MPSLAPAASFTPHGPASAALWEEARGLMPGGVNSPVRAFKAVGGDPVFFSRGAGAYLYDVDERAYVDCVGAWGPMIVGHAHPEVVAALGRAAANGFAFGAPQPGELELVKRVKAAMPSIEKLRLVNSGTEAVMSALRLARAATGRDLILKFVGCYHGHADALLVKAGSGVATLGLPDSPGVPAAATAGTLTAHFNSLEEVKAAFERHPGAIAAVLLEPVVGNSGVIVPEHGFLQGLRDLCTQEGALLVFDEVMTGFRVGYGGAQGLYNIQPDLSCLAKILGGGVPCGAYGGRADLMSLIAPEGSVYQAGTMSGNPLATAAGCATLDLLSRPGVYEGLEAFSSRLAAGLREAAAKVGLPVQVAQQGSMLTVFFTDAPVRDWPSADRCDRARFGRFFHGLLKRGVYWPPAQFEAAFFSTAHGERELAKILEAAEGAFMDCK